MMAKVRCLGYDIRREARRIKLRVGYMTQHFGLYQDLSIEENLDFIARVYRVEQRRRASKLRWSGLASSIAAAARRHAVGRVEAAPGAGRMPAARP